MSIILVFIFVSSVCFPVTNAYSYPLVGSKDSTVYHYSDCTYAKNIKQENIVTFTGEQDAVNQGYRPCTRCNPPQPASTITPAITPSPTSKLPTPTPTTITPTPKPTVTPTYSQILTPTATSTQTAKPTVTPTMTTASPTQTSTSANTQTPTPAPTETTEKTSEDQTPQPQLSSSLPTPSVPEFGVLSLLMVSALATVILLYLKKGNDKGR